MPIVQHKFNNHQVSIYTEILILGTFNPNIPAGPDFFYGRPRNYLWQLLPACWGLPSLKGANLAAKHLFMNTHKIDFADTIASVNVPVDEEDNVNDIFIDNKVHEWKNIVQLIDSLPKLKAVYFTRTTFGGIPNIRTQIRFIRSHCIQKKIRFCLLLTPSRFTDEAKQLQWNNTIIDQITCI